MKRALETLELGLLFADVAKVWLASQVQYAIGHAHGIEDYYLVSPHL
jgi:hypothetical protein